MNPRSFTSLLLVLALVLAAGASLAEDRTFGKGVSDASDVIPISTLLADPGEYLGKTVRVEGPVIGVCKARGCWMDLASDKEFQSIQIKVEDGEIVFPMDIMGQTAVAEGVLTALPLTLEQTRAYLKKETECQGGEFDVESVTEGMTLYRIQGTGAIVHPAEVEKDADAAAEEAAAKAEDT